MRSTLISSLYLAGVGAALTALGIYAGFLSSRELAPSELTVRLWSAIFVLLLVCWIIEDSRGRENIYKPFCFGFLLWVYLLPYTPYYLVKTRGAIGLLWILGAVALVIAGLFTPQLFRAAS